MPNDNINNDTKNGSNTKLIGTVILLIAFIFGGGFSWHHFNKNKKPELQPVIQKEENNFKKEEVEKIVEYIPVIDNLSLVNLLFIIVLVFAIALTITIIMLLLCGKFVQNRQGAFFLFLVFLSFFLMPFLFFLLEAVLWFIVSMILSLFSKIWDEEHTWWQNTKRCFFLRDPVVNAVSKNITRLMS